MIISVPSYFAHNHHRCHFYCPCRDGGIGGKYQVSIKLVITEQDQDTHNSSHHPHHAIQAGKLIIKATETYICIICGYICICIDRYLYLLICPLVPFNLLCFMIMEGDTGGVAKGAIVELNIDPTAATENWKWTRAIVYFAAHLLVFWIDHCEASFA